MMGEKEAKAAVAEYMRRVRIFFIIIVNIVK